MTVHRIIACSFAGGNGPGIMLDNAGARARNGNPATAGDLLISGSYFYNGGHNYSGIELNGRWTNVVVDAVRHEQHFSETAGGCGGPSSDTPFLRLRNGSHLSHFRIHAFSDGDESSPIVAGEGTLMGGLIVGHPYLNLTGKASSMRNVQLVSSQPLRLHVGGDALGLTVRAGNTEAAAAAALSARAAAGVTGGDGTRSGILAPPVIDVGGEMSIDDGEGGILIHAANSSSSSSGGSSGGGSVVTVFMIPRSGLISASCHGSMLLLQCVISRAAGRSACTQVSYHTGGSGDGGGSGVALSWACGNMDGEGRGACVIRGDERMSVRQIGGV
eukprot:COSAG05_NODE_370_length_10716_cov_5.748422_4_plen_330_part_00